MAKENNGTGLFYFLTGVAAGAALGVLFAPRPGDETRERVADWLKQRRAKGEELLHKVKDESLVQKEALVAAARAAKDVYRETNAKRHEHAGV